MKKIILALTLVTFGTMSAHALDRSNFSVTGGIALNQGVFGATAKETNRSDTNTIATTSSESGVFTESYESGFLELGIGEYVSLGYEHTPGSISTPTNTPREYATVTNVSVDFNDLNTMYATVNLGSTGIYAKYGLTEMDAAIKKTGTASTYSNVSIDGTVMGVGYNMNKIRDSRFGIRIEGAYYDFDNATTSNGVSLTGGSAANGGRNQIDASHLECLQG